jgi:hypothetical protein
LLLSFLCVVDCGSFQPVWQDRWGFPEGLRH